MALFTSRFSEPLGLTLTIQGGRPKTLRLGTWATWLVISVVPLLSAWYLGATVYYVFHDQLLASLMTRQMDMQYAYEDRISALRTQLDRATSRGLIDRRSLDTTLRDLMARGDELARHAATIDELVKAARPNLTAKLGTAAALPNGAFSQGETSDLDAIQPRPDLPGDLRMTDPSDEPSKHSELVHHEDVAALFERVDRLQSRILAQLRDPLVRSVSRLSTALVATGLPSGRWHLDASGVGGPFVPLPDGASFDVSVSILRDAIRERLKLEAIVDRVPLRRPLEGPLEVTSTFGPRLDPFFGRAAMHTGIDLHEEAGDAVKATAAGVVTIAGTEGGYGNMVEIDHGNGVATRYAHLSAIEVVPHQAVPAGFVVGRVGSTGRSTGPHLHYETRINGEPVDPARFLRAGSSLFPG